VIQTPEAGLVIFYAYLWHYEHRAGREEGRKDRPCVVFSVERAGVGAPLVTVLPVTHNAPADEAEAVEIPLPIKRHLGLDGDRSWIVVAEGNEFLWPGYDLRKIANADRYEYGFIPPKLFSRVLKAFVVCSHAGKTRVALRD